MAEKEIQSGNQRGPHRIARINYVPRTLGFGSTFIAFILLGYERDFSSYLLIAGVLLFLLYPHWVYLHAYFARDSKAVEKRYLLVDCALLGLWSAAMGLHLWISFSLLATSLLNNAVNGGVKRLGLAAILFLSGGLIWAAAFGLDFQPYASLRVDIFVMASSLLYIFGVGVTYFRQNQQLAQAHQDIAHKNRIFQSLLRLGMLTNETSDLQSMVRKALSQLQSLHPHEAFGLVRFAPDRPDLVEQAVFLGLSEESQAHLLSDLRRYNKTGSGDETIELILNGSPIQALPLDRHISRGAAYLLLSRMDSSFQNDELQLFVDQLGSALENKLLTEELRRAAETDGLTGLYNRAYLESKLGEAVAKKRDHESLDFAIIMIDLIGLKRANDEYGHEAGDALIRCIANGLLRQARNSDIVARFGGDEFVVLCANCNEKGARAAVDRLRSAVETKPCQATLADGRQVSLPVVLSIGVAGSDQYPAEEVVIEADKQMYENKTAYYETHKRYR